MLPLGKIRNEVLRKIILSDLPIDDEKIVVGP
ncbi:MAG: hydrogenase expression/formation protein HypE, partial [Thermococcaceae archaeon]|nr:hydrogenase expression/formation protein HypE [Thermococcaceae archaeon]